MRRPEQRIKLEREVSELEQYDFFGHEEIFSKHATYSKSIGMFLIAFSRLEVFLNYLLVKSIDERSDEPGIRIIKYLEIADKISLAGDQYRRLVGFIPSEKKRIKLSKDLDIIVKKLVEISEFRNKVAHANWITLDKRGFVRVDVKEDKERGNIVFRSVKMTPAVIRKFIRQTDSLVGLIDNFIENVDHQLLQ